VVDVRADGEPELHRHAGGFFIEHRQHARQRDIHRARLGVRFGAVFRGRAGKRLALREELGVDLEADDRFPFHNQLRNSVYQWCIGRTLHNYYLNEGHRVTIPT
jgi:hypothetical protein